MSINKKGADLINKAGRHIAEKEINEMIKINSKVYNKISDNCNIKADRVQIICPDNLQKYSISFNIKDRKVPNKLKLDFGDVKNVRIFSTEELKEYKQAVDLLEIGFVINFNNLPKDLDYIMEIEYYFQDHRFMRSFVNTDKSKDSPYKEDDLVSEYWLEAHLNHADLLRGQYRSIDLRDVDVGINVSIGQDINMKLPPPLKQKMKTMVDLYRGGGRSETWKRAMDLHRLQQGKYSGDSMDIINALQDFFTASIFSKYVVIKDDFSYKNCFRGKEFHDNLPIHNWPRFMKIVSLCDLSAERPAAKGILIYKRKDFVEEILKIIKAK